jgi:hypothetical protein
MCKSRRTQTKDDANHFPLRRLIMHCSLGTALHHRYEAAEKEKIAIHGMRVANGESPMPSEKVFSAAKQRYLESFADWLSHKAFCHDCKPKG